MVGKYNLSIDDERLSMSHSVRDILIHKDWAIGDPTVIQDTFDADIAVVVFRNSVKISRNVKPICLPEPSSIEVSGSGTVVGWGRSKAGEDFTSTPNELEMPTVNQTYCLSTGYRDDLIQDIASNRTFCAGFKGEDKGVCLADSGGGFYGKRMKSNENYWELTGIVSSSLIDYDSKVKCDISFYSLYTNVANFVPWIEEKLAATEEIKVEVNEYGCWNDEG